jgi:hypothetical protein
MQYVYGIYVVRDVYDPKASNCGADANFSNARADRRHGPPVVGVQPALDAVELVSRFSSGPLWKRP